jgi:hypothetical protein
MRNNAIYKLIILLLLVVIVVRFIKTPRHKENNYTDQHKEQPADKNIKPITDKPDQENKIISNTSIDELTNETVVVAYVKQNNRLPDYYISKREARKKGWSPTKGNLCDVLPGRAIGGDVFTNREGSLPEKAGRKWYEADLNYDCAHRNADRLLFSNDGLLFVTKDHYKTFVQQ